jgi:hypothetical protein
MNGLIGTVERANEDTVLGLNHERFATDPQGQVRDTDKNLS